jgi:hypothetical protein
MPGGNGAGNRFDTAVRHDIPAMTPAIHLHGMAGSSFQV